MLKEVGKSLFLAPPLLLLLLAFPSLVFSATVSVLDTATLRERPIYD
jgi:hypothetical protein